MSDARPRPMPATRPIAQLLQQGLFHHRQGDIPTAMERYAEVLSKDPKNTDALYYVAVIACQEGQFKQGVDLVRRALTFGGAAARACTICSARRSTGSASRWRRSRRSTRRSRSTPISPPRMATAPISWSMPACRQEALKSFDRAIELDPTSAPDLINRGALLQSLGRFDEALASFEQALAVGARRIRRSSTTKAWRWQRSAATKRRSPPSMPRSPPIRARRKPTARAPRCSSCWDGRTMRKPRSPRPRNWPRRRGASLSQLQHRHRRVEFGAASGAALDRLGIAAPLRHLPVFIDMRGIPCAIGINRAGMKRERQ